jgi:uncharacterized protein YpmB
LLLAKKNARELFLRSVQKIKIRAGKSFTNMKKKSHEGNKEAVAAIKDVNGRLTTDSIAMANSINIYYSSVLGCECSI